MKIIHASDTHGKHKAIDPQKLECDIFIHSGDITNVGELDILSDFCLWLDKIPAKNKIVIFGNHELGFAAGPKRKKAIKLVKKSAIYLENSFVIIDGIKIYGSPATPLFCNWEWNYERGSTIAHIWDQIPDDVNILITHGPSHGVLDLVQDNVFNIGRDLHQGCEDLRNRICELNNLKLHCFGHLHLSYGLVKIDDVIFSNGAICDESYQPNNLPNIIEL